MTETGVELEAGPEMDRAVAEAIGGFNFSPEYRVPSFTDELDASKFSKTFCPSTDLNDAFWAAESAGLFGRYVDLYRADGEWRVFRNWTSGKGGGKILGESATPAMAICKAILELRK